MEFRTAHTRSLPPGSAIYSGSICNVAPLIDAITYSSTEMQIEHLHALDQLEKSMQGSQRPRWIRCKGVHQTEWITSICKFFEIHAVSVEDIVNIHQAPKIEEFDDYLFVVLRLPVYDEDSHQISSNQISLILFADLVLSFEESGSYPLDAIVLRMSQNMGRIRKEGTPYLGYALIDLLIDEYLHVTGILDTEIIGLEQQILGEGFAHESDHLFKLMLLTTEFSNETWPLTEITRHLLRHDFYADPYGMYLNDLHEHAAAVIRRLQMISDKLGTLMNLQMSRIAHKQNKIMNTLTIVGSIFIPLTFIAGVYGMNFKYMPELNFPFMYPTVLGGMTLIALGMLWYFRRKKML